VTIGMIINALCWPCMTVARKIKTLARLIVDKHGPRAHDLVADRAIESFRHRDYKVAAMWSEVACRIETLKRRR
jgi:hypothetical protein